MSRHLSAFLGLLLCLLGLAAPARAELTAEQKQEIQTINNSILRAGQLFAQGKHQESGEVVKSAHTRFEKLSANADAEMVSELDLAYRGLLQAQKLLSARGVKVPAVAKPTAKMTKPATPKPATPAPTGAVSFKSHVAPILVSKCGRCHVNRASGQFSMANFTSLMRGPAGQGAVVQAGDPVGSRLVETIEQGDMPRGGAKVSPTELATLKKWIAAGAKYDGGDPQMNLADLSGASVGAAAKVEMAQATGKETISFSADIAPVLAEKCANCHGRGQRPSGRFNLLTFSRMFRGGESGPAIIPGKPAESLLLQKIKGTASGERMPLRQPALPDDVIAKIETWIRENATFDGPDQNQDVQQVANLAKAKAATPEELSADRMKEALKNWGLGMPGIDAQTVETDGFFLAGNLGQATMEKHGELAETLAPKIAEFFGAPSDQSLIKGRISLYLLKQRYDYTEFGKMVEKRDLPKSSRGHWRYNIVDAYGVAIPSYNDAYSLEALLAQQVAGIYVASLNSPPKWFSEGAARAAAAHIAPEDSRVTAWDDQIGEAVASQSKADDFLNGKLPQELSDAASYSFVKMLMGNKAGFQKLLGDLKKGDKFELAFSKVYGMSPSQAADYWVKRAGSKKRRRR